MKHYFPFLIFFSCTKTINDSFISGAIWNDSEGDTINAHGGGILYYQGKYYWFGEMIKENKFKNDTNRLCFYRCAWKFSSMSMHEFVDAHRSYHR